MGVGVGRAHAGIDKIKLAPAFTHVLKSKDE